jgi:hypothetical protein
MGARGPGDEAQRRSSVAAGRRRSTCNSSASPSSTEGAGLALAQSIPSQSDAQQDQSCTNEEESKCCDLQAGVLPKKLRPLSGSAGNFLGLPIILQPGCTKAEERWAFPEGFQIPLDARTIKNPGREAAAQAGETYHQSDNAKDTHNRLTMVLRHGAPEISGMKQQRNRAVA